MPRGPQVRQRELRLVVQHLLEVRHPPLAVGRVPVEAAPEMVANAPARDLIEGCDGHSERLGVARTRVPIEQKQHLGLGWELGRRREPSALGIKPPCELRNRPILRPGIERSGRVGACDAAHRHHEPLGTRVDLSALGLPQVGNLLENVQEMGTRHVGRAKERFAIGRKHHRHRPPAAPGQHLHRQHVRIVDVWALLAVDLDRHEVRVQGLGDIGVLETLPRHHMAPVARRVAHGKEDGLVLPTGLVERLVAPRVPVHGVLNVLEQIGAVGADQMIALFLHLFSPTGC